MNELLLAKIKGLRYNLGRTVKTGKGGTKKEVFICSNVTQL